MESSSWVTMFVCANCARPGKEITSAHRARPEAPDFGLPANVRMITIPCAGRLQPENVLKAFEAGSDVVAVAACEEGNCHYAEGSRRWALRAEWLQSLLQEIGLGEGRLVLGHLPGSAEEDLHVVSDARKSAASAAGLENKIEALRTSIIEALRVCPPNPLRLLPQDPAGDGVQEEAAAGEGGRR